MQQAAETVLSCCNVDSLATLTLYDGRFNEGVVGLVASRLKEKVNRPTIVFAPTDDGALKGSGRSIAGVHLRDALDLVSKALPGAVLRFGGHAWPQASRSGARATCPPSATPSRRPSGAWSTPPSSSA